jgi:hypothetical protein
MNYYKLIKIISLMIHFQLNCCYILKLDIKNDNDDVDGAYFLPKTFRCYIESFAIIFLKDKESIHDNDGKFYRSNLSSKYDFRLSEVYSSFYVGWNQTNHLKHKIRFEATAVLFRNLKNKPPRQTHKNTLLEWLDRNEFKIFLTIFKYFNGHHLIEVINIKPDGYSNNEINYSIERHVFYNNSFNLLK